ncbi:MAG TPA: hypothetical protein VM187_07145 [Niastella sp.]|nr:hypothetical protein [Niastella sp.]
MLLQKIKYSPVLFLCVAGFNTYAQVEINNNVVLTGTNPADQQIRHVNSELDSTNLVSASTYQSGAAHFSACTALSTDSLLVTTQAQVSAYEPGLLLNFIVPNNNHDSVFVNVNNMGWIKLKYKNRSFTPQFIKTGQVLQVVFDGASFQIMNSLAKTCPEGFKSVNESFCIENTESSTATFFNASVTCASKNAKLCTWNEWYYACQKTSLGLSNMTNNYEWIDSAGNSNHQAAILGNGGCGVRAVSTDTTVRNFRCCYSR